MVKRKKAKPAMPDMSRFQGMALIAYDLSLTSTGWATEAKFGTIAVSTTGMRRLNDIYVKVVDDATLFSLVIFEGLATASNNPSAKERAGLAYMIQHRLWLRQIPYVLIPPTTLKKFVTGRGNVDKDVVMKDVYKRWGHDCTISDEADACAAMHYGLQLCGTEAPQNEFQRECLTKCEVVMPEVAL